MAFHDFPADLYPTLLSKLPTKTLLRFKSVSKLWLSIIIDTKFSSGHAKHLCYSASKSSTAIAQICLLKSMNHDEVSKICEIKWSGGLHAVFEEFRNLPIIDKHVRLVGSSNGVLCLVCEYEMVRVILSNPLSKKYYCLPPLPPHIGTPSHSYIHVIHSYGFGYDEVNDDYKVVCLRIPVFRNLGQNVAQSLWREDNAVIYSLKSSTWRSIDKFPVPSKEGGVLFDGALHWIALDGSLIAFDLSKEEFNCFTLPSLGVANWYAGLQVLRDGRLCHMVSRIGGCKSVWLMANYSHWRGELLLKPPTYIYWKLKPIAYVEHPNQVLMIYEEGSGNNISFYDVENQSIIDCEGSNMDGMFSRDVLPYIQTLELY